MVECAIKDGARLRAGIRKAAMPEALFLLPDYHYKGVELSIRPAAGEAEIDDGAADLDIIERNLALTIAYAVENRRPFFNKDCLRSVSR